MVKFGLFRLKDFIAEETFVLRDGSTGRLARYQPEPGILHGWWIGPQGNDPHTWRPCTRASAPTEEAARRIARRVAQRIRRARAKGNGDVSRRPKG